MADLTTQEKFYLEKLFQMGGGYVLDFSNRTMGDFFADVGIEIYDDKYAQGSGSKAHYMRGFWREASNPTVGRVIDELIGYIEMKVSVGDFDRNDYSETLIDSGKEIAKKLQAGVAGSVTTEKRMEEFLKQDFAEINKSIQSLDAGTRDVIQQRVDEASKILDTAPLAAIFLIGSTLEGILLEFALNNATEYVAATAAPRQRGAVTPINEWRLNSLIDASYELNYLSKNVRDFSQVLRDFRNYIHPREQARAQFNPNTDTSKICFQVLKAAITEIDAAKQATAAS